MKPGNHPASYAFWNISSHFEREISMVDEYEKQGKKITKQIKRNKEK